MKVKNKKTILAVVLILFLVIGVTIAYFTSSASFENIFSTGTYKVVTTEVFESPDNWAPGEEIPKTITTTNEGTIPAAVRVSYTEQWLDGDTDITSSIDEGTAIINLDNTSEWTKEGNYYYYNYILNPNDTTSSFIKSVTLNPEIGDDVTCTTSQNGLTKTCESQNPALGAKYKLTLTKETVQVDKYQEVWNTNVSIIEKPASSITYLTRQVEGQITPGDEIGIGETEDFYVISSDENKTVLLAKYNLLIGNIIEDRNVVGVMDSSNTPGYGLQSVDAVGGYTKDFGKGAVYFTTTNYWLNGSDLLSPYNENDTIYSDSYGYRYRSDDSDAYPYIYDENSNVYQYISGEDGYVNRLKLIGAPSTITGRLLSYQEADAVKNVLYDNHSIIFDRVQDYWLGSLSPNDMNGVYLVQDGDYFASTGFHELQSFSGVRPVIEIPTSELK